MGYSTAELAAIVAFLTENYSWDAGTVGGMEDIEDGFRAFRAIYEYRATEHSGDCTKECHACLRCKWDGYVERAREIVRRLEVL